MAVFGKNQFKKNKVYYRRKSYRLQNYAVGLAALICLAGMAYYVYNRTEIKKDGVDQLTTTTLRIHEPIKYYHLKYFGGADETNHKKDKKQ